MLSISDLQHDGNLSDDNYITMVMLLPLLPQLTILMLMQNNNGNNYDGVGKHDGDEEKIRTTKHQFQRN